MNFLASNFGGPLLPLGCALLLAWPVSAIVCIVLNTRAIEDAELGIDGEEICGAILSVIHAGLVFRLILDGALHPPGFRGGHFLLVISTLATLSAVAPWIVRWRSGKQ